MLAARFPAGWLPKAQWLAWHPSSPNAPAYEQVHVWSCSPAILGPGSNAKQSVPMPVVLARACAHGCARALPRKGRSLLCSQICISEWGCPTAEPGKGSTSLRSPLGRSTGVGTSWARGKHHFASGTCSGAGMAWQETPRVAELQ